MKNNKFPSSILLIVLVIVIALIPLIFLKNAEFAGADDKAKDVREGVLDVLNDWNKEITKSLTEEEEEMLKSLLEKVCKNINV